MDWTTFIGPAAIAAAVSGVITMVVMFVNRATSIKVNQDKIRADTQLAERKFAFDKELAERRFTYDRQQAIFRRRFELAEQVLADAYRFRDLMKYVRSGFSFVGEGETRQTAGTEPEGIKRTKDNYFVPIERLQKESEFISAMMAKRHASSAHFGADSEKAFKAFNAAMHHVRVASSMLIQLADDHHPNNQELQEKMRCDISEPMAEHEGQNRIGKEVDEGVMLIEGFCRPVLEESSSK